MILTADCRSCGEEFAPGISTPMASFVCSDCLEDMTCRGCGAVEGTPEYGTVGDGFDGYCPSCADKREEDGTVEKG